MRSRWRSYFYVPILALFLAAGGSFLWGLHSVTPSPVKEQIYDLDEYFQADMTKPTEVHAVDDKNVLLEKSTSEIQTEQQAEFVLRVANGHVTVYKNGNADEIFMTTGILAEELPTETKKEILNGKEIVNEQELYFFLESYSS